MRHQTAVRVKSEDTVILYGTPRHTIIAGTDGGQRATRIHVQIGKMPRPELGFPLGQQQQSALLTAHPQIILVVFKQRPHIRCVQVERCTGIFISSQGALALGNPAESVAQRSQKQVTLLVLHGRAQQHILSAQSAQVEIVLIHHAVAIVQQSVTTDHQHATLVVHESRYRTVRRLKLLQPSLSVAPDDAATMSRLPEIAVVVEMNIAEVVVVFSGIALQLFRFQRAVVQTEQSVTGRSDQQVRVVLLNDKVDARQCRSTFQCHVAELVAGSIIQVQAFLRAHP